MDFFSKLGESLSEAGKDVSRKAKDMTGIAKLNLDIKAKEDYISKQYAAMGKQYYELHQEDVEPLFEEILLIKEAKTEILRMEQELAGLKGMKKCQSCGNNMEQEAQFCPSCGAKYESIFEDEEVVADAEPVAAPAEAVDAQAESTAESEQMDQSTEADS